jgi:hypothetical protein
VDIRVVDGTRRGMRERPTSLALQDFGVVKDGSIYCEGASTSLHASKIFRERS